jgi:signal transduction histidine kinase
MDSDASAELSAEREARLRAEAERDFYRRVLDQAPVPLNVHLGSDLRFHIVHPSTQVFFDNRELMGVDPREIDGGPGHRAVVETAYRVLASGVTQRLDGHESEVLLADGRKVTRRYDLVLRRLEDAERGPLGVIVQFSETRDRLSMQRRLEGVLDALPIPVALTDPSTGSLLFANERAVAITAACEQADAAQSPPPAASGKCPGDALACTRTSEFSAELPDGEHHFRASTRLVPGRGASPPLLMHTAVDVTSEKEALAALAAAGANELRRSEFLAQFAHEIRNPLNTVVGFAELALLEQLSAAEDREFWQRVHDAGRQTLALANDYLDAQAMDAGRLALRPVAFSPHALIEDAVASITLAARGKGLEIRLAPGLDALPAALEADAARVRQILLNLLTNAVKFTDAGSITVDGALRRLPDGLELHLVVEDTGIGIDADLRARLFSPYARAGGEAGRRPGVGLGLDLSRRLAQHLGGDLVLTRSEPGQGSRFELSIRAKTVNGASAPASVASR